MPLVVNTGESIKFKLSAYHFTKILLEYCLGGDYPFALHLLQSCSGDVVIIFVSSVMSKGVRLIMTQPCLICSSSPGQLSSRYQNITKKELSKTDGGFAYDAVWAIALALKKTEEHLRRLNPSQSIVNFTYVNEDIMKQFKSYLNKTQFQGVTVSTKHS